MNWRHRDLRGNGPEKTSGTAQDSAGLKLPPPAKKTIDLEARLIKDGVRKAICDRQNALHELLNAINRYPEAFGEQALDVLGFGLCSCGSGVK
jgi:hypothetical protein